MLRFLTTLAALLMPIAVFAAGGEGHHAEAEAIPWTKMAFHAINLAILLGGIAYVAKTPLMDALKDRSLRVKKDLEESHSLRKEARDRFDELDAKLAHFDQRLTETRAAATAEAEAEAARIAEKTVEEVAWVQEAAEKTIRDELVQARRSLQREAVDLAVKIAEESLSSRISADDQDRMARDLLGAVKQEVNGHG